MKNYILDLGKELGCELSEDTKDNLKVFEINESELDDDNENKLESLYNHIVKINEEGREHKSESLQEIVGSIFGDFEEVINNFIFLCDKYDSLLVNDKVKTEISKAFLGWVSRDIRLRCNQSGSSENKNDCGIKMKPDLFELLLCRGEIPLFSHANKAIQAIQKSDLNSDLKINYCHDIRMLALDPENPSKSQKVQENIESLEKGSLCSIISAINCMKVFFGYAMMFAGMVLRGPVQSVGISMIGSGVNGFFTSYHCQKSASSMKELCNIKNQP